MHWQNNTLNSRSHSPSPSPRASTTIHLQGARWCLYKVHVSEHQTNSLWEYLRSRNSQQQSATVTTALHILITPSHKGKPMELKARNWKHEVGNGVTQDNRKWQSWTWRPVSPSQGKQSSKWNTKVEHEDLSLLPSANNPPSGTQNVSSVLPVEHLSYTCLPKAFPRSQQTYIAT